ncbi:hypothetical protein L226DRAFT_135894 [Lentinus tigrinus ALCF2SS1-7]|uniref:uncharacterized protein n=1 Tax=Lentinus tigrinus ALCF2SS1-7 TaxID=1328758 RepID=UPI001165F3A1|nr:hypothetical protein L226DRAFT_135894 [Lentinus tigrinus ALCF2SS1-7]
MQEWYLINVDRKQMSNQYGPRDSFSRVFTMREDEQPCRSLFPPCLPPQVDVWCNSNTIIAQTSALFALPPELLGMIFTKLEELHRTVAFAITCRYLLSVGKMHILRAAREFHAPWAGCRIMCVGLWTKDDDLPAGMLTSKEIEEVAAWSRGHIKPEGAQKETEGPVVEEADSSSESEDEESIGSGFLGYVYTHYRLALSQFWTLRRSEDALLLMQAIERDDARRKEEEHSYRNYESDSRLFDTVFGHRVAPGAPSPRASLWIPHYPTGTRVLCNLSKAEYVREDGMSLARGPRRGITWVHVLLSLVSWSSDSDTGLPMSAEHSDSFHRGRWAGDRICMGVLEQLTDLEDAADVTGEACWRDVSLVADEILLDIWDRYNPGFVDDNVPYKEWEIRAEDSGRSGISSAESRQ